MLRNVTTGETRALPSGDRLHFQVDNFLTAVLSTVSWRLTYVGVKCFFCLILLLVGPGKTKPLKMRVNFLCVKVTWLHCFQHCVEMMGGDGETSQLRVSRWSLGR